MAFEKSFFTVYLPSKYREALRQLAAHEDTTMSEIVRALIKARVEHLIGGVEHGR